LLRNINKMADIELYLRLEKFQKYSPNYYQKYSDNVLTSVILEPLEICSSNLDQNITKEKLLELSKIYHGLDLIKHMLNWLTNNEQEIETNNDTIKLEHLIEHNKDRLITIYTWGIGIRKVCPIKAEINFDLSNIHTEHNKKSMRNHTGLEQIVQNEFMQSEEFMNYLNKIIQIIEKNNHNIISISCSQGKHRSVSMAEIIKQYYYPNAQLIHLELNN